MRSAASAKFVFVFGTDYFNAAYVYVDLGGKDCSCPVIFTMPNFNHKTYASKVRKGGVSCPNMAILFVHQVLVDRHFLN